MHDVQGALSKLYRLAWSKRMIAKRPLQEVDANLRNGEPMWRETGDGHGVTLIATDTGLAAIDIETKDANLAPAGTTRTSREGTKQAALIAVLLGFLLAAAPIAGMFVGTIWIGTLALVQGALQIWAAFKVRKLAPSSSS